MNTLETPLLSCLTGALTMIVFVVGSTADPNVANAQQLCATVPIAANLTSRNRISGTALQRLIIGARVRYHRVLKKQPDAKLDIQRQYRTDGSLVVSCTITISGRTRNCYVRSVKGGREVGTWRLTRKAICIRYARIAGSREYCNSFHRVGGKIWAKDLGSVPSCLAGVILVSR